MNKSGGSEILRQREFIFNRDDFLRIKKLIYEHAGISLNDNKQEMVYSRLARRLRQHNFQSFKEYLDYLQTAPDEWESFTNALTTNLTSFFREAHHFPILAEHLLQLRHQPIRIWSAASSTGEEPYSIAMTVVETFNQLNPSVEIIATDLDTHVLQKAREAIYAVDRVHKMEPERVKRFFLRGKNQFDGFVRIRPELCRMIDFRQLNLLDESWNIKGPFDVIFCRNVMIYFDKETQYKILKKFVPLLRPDGLLFTGHSESFLHATDLFKPLGKTVYRLANASDV